jgi:3-oxoacyl-[acyl-carrier protein] reductase
VGVDGRARFAELSQQEWDRVVSANLTSGFLVTQATLGLVADHGSIIYIGASAGMRGRPESAHYCASKTALNGLTRSLAREVGGRGVRVNTVAPGVIVKGPGDGPPPPVAEQIKAVTALGRLGAPDEVAAAVLFLASDASRYITGVTLNVDGGV